MNSNRRWICLFSVLGCLVISAPLAAVEKVDLRELTLRVRVTKLTPDVPVRVKWRYGGEGQGGGVTQGEFTRLKRVVPTAPKDLAIVDAPKKNVAEDDLLGDIKSAGKAAPEAKVIEVEGGAYEYVYLKRDAWSPPQTYVDLHPGGRHPAIYTVTLEPYGDETAAAKLRDCELEFELSYRGKLLKTFTEIGPDGPTFGLASGGQALRAGYVPTDPKFIDEVSGLAEYSRRRTADLAVLPWAARPVPKLYAILTDCAGYKPGLGYGCRTTNMKVMENEFLTLRQLGMNGIRGCPPEIVEMANRREGWAAQFTRARISGAGGYPVPSADRDEETGKLQAVPEGAGDPFYPGVADRFAPQRQEAVDRLLSYRGFDEVWGLTVDEIGNVFGKSAEGKNLIYTSPYCMAAFREYLQLSGVTLEDVAAKSWDEVDPWTSLGPRPLNGKQVWEAEKKKLHDKTLGFAVKEPALDGKTNEKDDILLDLEKPRVVESDDDAIPTGASRLPPRATNLIHYYIARFVNYASAKSFEPLRDALAAENAKKQAALARGETDGAAKQPWIYSYALRGQTFIRRHSLDFFEFYRHADNALVYETSHTDRVTQIFDSYICDVGRIVSEKMDKKFGIYVKPHRGSGNQRAMSFVARGGTMLYWYTYGPGWFKGDSFSTNPATLHSMSRFARILARAEETLYGAKWAERPQTAIVKPRTTTLLGGRIDNALWNYAALAHSHVPVDPLDETMLETEDLSHYKVIYVGGEYLRRASAVKLAEWVHAGGTLYTADQGMMWDEAKQPLLDVLGPVFGVQSRDAWEVFDKDRPSPPGAELKANGDYAGGFLPSARETLTLASSTEVLASFADGKPAAVRNTFGKGRAYLVAFPAGSDYGKFVRTGGVEKPIDLDMEKNADPGRRRYIVDAALQTVQRPVTVSRANVEAVLVRHPQSGKRAVPLMNWAYLKDEENPRQNVVFTDVVVTLTDGRDVTKVTSAWLDREVPFERDGDALRINLPELADCDVLLLE